MTEIEHRLDDLSKAVAGGQSRRQVVKLGLGMVGAAIASAFSGRAAWGADPPGGGNGNSDCAHFCQSLPPGQRGACVSEAAHGDQAGFCARCKADISRICGGVENQTCCDPTAGQFCCPLQHRCLTCPKGEIPNVVDCTCECPAGTERCGGACVPACPGGLVLNPTTCVCECPPSNPNGCLQGNFCAGQTVCGAPPPASLGCATIEAANGQCFCHQIQLCAGLQACTNSSTCPAGWVCAHSCCDFAFLCATHCLPPCGTHPQSPEANPELAAAAVGRTSGSATPIA